MHEALEDSLDGRGRIFLLAGEPGIGKSRLADEIGQHARSRGVAVLWGRCWDGGGAPAYWPWIQAFRSYIIGRDPDALRAEIGSAAADVAQMLPDVSEVLTDLPKQAAPEAEGARFRVFESTSLFLKRIARVQPLMIVLDDLQAADTPSLLFLRFFAAELSDARILLVGTYRDTEISRKHPLVPTLTDLARQQVTRTLVLRGLLEDDVARFIEVTAGAPPPVGLVSAVHQETEGNPLFVREVVRLLDAEGRLKHGVDLSQWRFGISEGVRDVIGRRLQRLSETCNHVLAVASVVGREFNVDLLERVSDRPRDELLDLMDEGLDAGVLEEVVGAPGHLRFAHALIREALYEDLSTAARVRFHRRVGEVLEELYSSNREPHLTELAHHFFEAMPGGDIGRAVHYARLAGQRAALSLAYEEAIRLFQIALQGWDIGGGVGDENERCDLLLALGDAQIRSGDAPSAKASFRQAADLASHLDLPQALAHAALGYGGRFIWGRGGSDTKLVSLLEDALRALGTGDSELRVRVLARLAGALRDQPSRDRSAELSEEAVASARRIGDARTLAYALDGRCWAILWPENPDQRLEIARELVRLSVEMGDKERAAAGHLVCLIALLELGEMAGVKAELAEIARLAQELRQPAQRWSEVQNRATLAIFEGHLEDGERLIHEALNLGQRAQNSDCVITYRIQSFSLLKERGRLAELEDTVNRSVFEYPYYPMLWCVQANLYAELGRQREARNSFETIARERFAGLPLDNEWLYALTLLAEVAFFLDDQDRAETLYAMLAPYKGRNAFGVAEACSGAVDRYLGILCTVQGRLAEAEDHLQNAIEMNERLGAAPFVAHTQHDYARMLVRRGSENDRASAIGLASTALGSAERLGLHALTGRVAELLQELGSPSVSPKDGDPHRDGAARYALVREGEYWLVVFGDDSFRLRDSKGIGHLARLLAEPAREFHVLDLIGLEADGSESSHPGPSSGDELSFSGLGDAGAILDPVAKAAYRQRLSELEDELAEADAWGDSERSARAQQETQFLTRQLAEAVGLGGRDRKAVSASERARVNVTRAIKSALDRIAKHSPALADHLTATVRTGTFCSYTPDPRIQIVWRV